MNRKKSPGAEEVCYLGNVTDILLLSQLQKKVVIQLLAAIIDLYV